jgi:ketosteroid isomerase-like protein
MRLGRPSGTVLAMTAEPSTEQEVLAAFEDYERALLAHDVDRLGEWFWNDPQVLRFGVADREVGYEELQAWRAVAGPVSPTRRMTSRHVLVLSDDVACVDITFEAEGQPSTGRQSQVWQRRPEGWRIVRAHVSLQQ